MADSQSGAGGCKAPIAIAVMMGRALGVQIYGKHEFFAWHSHHQLPAAAHCPGWSIGRNNMSFFQVPHKATDCVSASQCDDELGWSAQKPA